MTNLDVAESGCKILEQAPRGKFVTIDKPFFVPPETHIQVDPSTTIVSEAASMVHMSPGSTIQGGTWVSVVDTRDSQFQFYGGYYDRFQRQGLSDMVIMGDKRSGSSTLVSLRANGGKEKLNAIQWCRFNNLILGQCGRGIELYCDEDEGELAFVNGNMFSDVFMERFVEGVVLSSKGKGATVAGNHFRGFQYQCRPKTQFALQTKTNRCIKNIFDGHTIFDFKKPGSHSVIAADIDRDLDKNRFSNFPHTRLDEFNLGKNNELVGEYSNP